MAGSGGAVRMPFLAGSVRWTGAVLDLGRCLSCLSAVSADDEDHKWCAGKCDRFSVLPQQMTSSRCSKKTTALCGFTDHPSLDAGSLFG